MIFVVTLPILCRMSLLCIYLSICRLVCFIKCLFFVRLSHESIVYFIGTLAILFTNSKMCVLRTTCIRHFISIHVTKTFFVHTPEMLCLVLWRLVMYLVLRKWRSCVFSNNFFNSLFWWQTSLFVQIVNIVFCECEKIQIFIFLSQRDAQTDADTVSSI